MPPSAPVPISLTSSLKCLKLVMGPREDTAFAPEDVYLCAPRNASLVDVYAGCPQATSEAEHRAYGGNAIHHVARGRCQQTL